MFLFIFLRADIIHIHISNKSKLYIAICSRLLGKKVIYTHHNSRIQRVKLFSNMVKWCNHIILVNTQFITVEEKWKHKISNIPAFIEPTNQEPLPHELLKLLDQYPFIISTNCFHLDKPKLINGKDCYGFDLLVEAFQKITEENKIDHALMVMVDTMGVMKNFTADLLKNFPAKKSSKVYYCTENINFPALIKRSHVVMRTTRSDGDSLTVREALLMGVPVIASNITNRPEGTILYETENINDLAEKIFEIYSGKKSAPLVQEDFGKKIAALYLAL